MNFFSFVPWLRGALGGGGGWGLFFFFVGGVPQPSLLGPPTPQLMCLMD